MPPTVSFQVIHEKTDSKRGKGIAFHPTLPWLFVGFNNGLMEIWDYDKGEKLNCFENLEEEVFRGIDCHPDAKQHLFCCGGQTGKVLLYNYDLTRLDLAPLTWRKLSATGKAQFQVALHLLHVDAWDTNEAYFLAYDVIVDLFTFALEDFVVDKFHAHLDYVRSVQFHKSKPWILSCSDDQQCKIIDYEERQCLYAFTGHNHYTLSCSFDSSHSYIITGCLDNYARLWKVPGLHPEPAPSFLKSFLSSITGVGSYCTKWGSASLSYTKESRSPDITLSAHTRGVNHAVYHPNRSDVALTSSDDRTIILWDINWASRKGVPKQTFSGHINNVSAAIYYPRADGDLIVSISEDRTIRTWDPKGPALSTGKYDTRNERYWSMAIKGDVIAASMDFGFIIFSIDVDGVAPKKLMS